MRFEAESALMRDAEGLIIKEGARAARSISRGLCGGLVVPGWQTVNVNGVPQEDVLSIILSAALMLLLGLQKNYGKRGCCGTAFAYAISPGGRSDCIPCAA